MKEFFLTVRNCDDNFRVSAGLEKPFKFRDFICEDITPQIPLSSVNAHAKKKSLHEFLNFTQIDFEGQ